MKAKVIRSYIDKYTMKDIDKGTEIEITEERFGELTSGPQGVFVEEIKDVTIEVTPPEKEGGEKATIEEEPPKIEAEKEDKKKSTKK